MAVFDLFKRLVNQNASPADRRSDGRVRAALGARVLVVDDSATIRAVLGKMLVQDGYEVLKAADGESAVAMAHEQFPDLILLDIVLPGMSGFAVLRALRRDTRTRTTPIIMMSGNQQATEQFYVQRFGADGFVRKPFGRVEVFDSIRSLVQAGRMTARTETPAVEAIPDGVTAEEWNAIPDVAMPDEAHVVVQSALTDASAAAGQTSAEPAAVSADPTSSDLEPVAQPERAPAMPPDATDEQSAVVPVAGGGWSVPLVSMAMQTTVSTTIATAEAGANPRDSDTARLPSGRPNDGGSSSPGGDDRGRS